MREVISTYLTLIEKQSFAFKKIICYLFLAVLGSGLLRRLFSQLWCKGAGFIMASFAVEHSI